MVHVNQTVPEERDGNDYCVAPGVLNALLQGDADAVFSHFQSDTHEPLTLTWAPDKDGLPSLMMQRFYEAWSEMPSLQPNAVPNVNDFDVFKFRAAMGFMMYMDVIDGGEDFQFRVFGSRVADFIGFDWTGRLVSDLPASPSCRAYLMTCYRAILQSKQPLYTKHRLRRAEAIVEWERFLVPLCDESQSVSRILGLSVPILISPGYGQGETSTFSF
jgi:PAS domain-containing protein